MKNSRNETNSKGETSLEKSLRINIGINIAVKIIVISVLVLVVLYAVGTTGYNRYVTTSEKEALLETESQEKEAEELVEAEREAKQAQVDQALKRVNAIGETANLGDIEFTLTEQRVLDVLQAVDCTVSQGLCFIDRPERKVIGLKFSITNISTEEQEFNRFTGAIATSDNIKRPIDDHVVLSGSEDYLQELGDYYTSASKFLLVAPDETKVTWIVIEIDTKISDPIYLYSPNPPTAMWKL